MLFSTLTALPARVRARAAQPRTGRFAHLATACTLALAAACGGQQEAEDGAAYSGPILINVTAAAEPVPGGVVALAAMPRTQEPWRGVLFAASGDGGLVAYDVDGAQIAQEAGPRYASLAAAPDFQLRMTDLPLLAGVDIAGEAVSVYAFSRDQSALFLAPTEPIAPDLSPRGVCASDSSASSFEFYVLGEAGEVELWRLRDGGAAGGDVLTAERAASFQSPVPARMCAAHPDSGEVFVASPLGGVVRISADGEVLARADVEAAGMAFGLFAGRRRLVVTQSGGDVLMLDPETLQVSERARITQGFSTPGVDAPGAVAYTPETFGGAYPDGFLAIGDAGDERPKFIDRGYIGRRLSEPENPFAPGPASAA